MQDCFSFLYSIFTFQTSLVYEYNKYLHSLRFRRQTRNRNGCPIKLFNESYPYADADDNTFCGKTGIYARGGTELSVGGLLMLGKLDSIHRLIPSFWVDYMEIPGTSYNDASRRYTFRMQENL